MSKEHLTLFQGERIDPRLFSLHALKWLSLEDVKNMCEVTGKKPTPWGLWHTIRVHQARYQFANLALNLGEGATVLDTGCGTGYSNKIFTQKIKWYGADISEEALRFARKHNSRGAVKHRLITADGCRLPIEKNFFDAVVSIETLEHIPLEQVRSFLRSISFVLKPGGSVVISIPNREFTNLNGTINSKPDNHFHCFEPNLSEFKKMLEPSFNNLSFYYQTGIIMNPDSTSASPIERGLRILAGQFWQVKPLESLDRSRETPAVYLAVGTNP